MRARKLILTAVALVLAVAALFAIPKVRLRFEANRTRHLVNSQRYREALELHDRLAAHHDVERVLGQNFAIRTIERAHDYFMNFERRPHPSTLRPGSPDATQYEALLAAAEQHASLAARARQLRLELTARRDAQSSATLQAARQILEHEGFDSEALWWVTRALYDPNRPLIIPADLERFRENINASSLEPDDAAGDRHLPYLRALLALNDRNWAEAASHLRRVVRDAEDPLGLPLGLALLRAGRHADAVAPLRARAQHPATAPDALAWLAFAYLNLRESAWAAETFHRIQQTNPQADALELLWPFVHDRPTPVRQASSSPLSNAAERMRSVKSDPCLLLWFHWVSARSTRDAELDQAARQLAAGCSLDFNNWQSLAQYALLRNQIEALRELAARPPLGFDFNNLSGVATTSSVVDPSLRMAIQRLIASRSARAEDAATTPPLARFEAGRLLTRNTTEHFQLMLPAEARLAVLQVNGYQARNVWPLVHIELGGFGSGSFYAADSRSEAIPLLIVIKRPLPANQPIDIDVSLLNADQSGLTNPNVRLNEWEFY